MFREIRNIMALARDLLRGKWGVAAASFLVYLVLSMAPGGMPHIGWIIGLIVAGPLLTGLHIFFLSAARGKELKTGQLFEGFSSFTNSLVAYLLAAILILLWSLLLVVPGIMAALSYSMTFFILADNTRIDGLDALRRSKAMMAGHRWRLSCLLGRFTGWLLLGICTFGIGFLWVGPYLMTSMALFYDELRMAVQPDQETPREIAPA